MVPAPVNPHDEIVAQWEAMNVDERRDVLRDAAAKNPPADTELLDAYIEYAVTVSPDWMAMSFPAAVFLASLCESTEAKVVADFGSGFSSVVLRRYAAQSGAHVVSVDDNPEWLGRTAQFLESLSLPTDDLVLWDDWLAGEWPPMDVAFHDLASGDLREAAMPLIADRMRTGGHLVFDDAHNQSHKAAMDALTRSRGWMLAALPETRDGHGRFDAMVVCRAVSAP